MQFDSKEYLLPAMKEELKSIKFPPETDEKDLIIANNIFKEHTQELFQTYSYLLSKSPAYPLIDPQTLLTEFTSKTTSDDYSCSVPQKPLNRINFL